jgi:methyltransferase family protein
MQYFWDWAVRPLLVDRRTRHVLEIGASLGGNTDRIVRHFPDVRISVIDPCLDTDLTRKYRDVPSVTVHVGRSLEVLPSLQGSYDVVLIDGDHNYYTVVNELHLISRRRLLVRGGMILLHDVGQPWARSDLYYEPERIPAAARLAQAPHGVLTAVEHFLRDSDRRWMWLRWSAEHGLGALIDKSSGASESALRVKTFLWRSIRWRNRLLRWSGLRPPDAILWGKEA